MSTFKTKFQDSGLGTNSNVLDLETINLLFSIPKRVLNPLQPKR
jgi:hypothetical protein